MNLKAIQARKERAEPERSLVGFLVGDVAYAIPISKVREIINPIPLTVLPRSPEAVAGVADHRGEVVTVINLRVHFGLPDTETQQRRKWILIDRADGAIGLIVDRMTEVFGTGGRPLKPTPPVEGINQRGLVGVTNHADRLTFVLDTERFGKLVDSIQAGAPHNEGGG